MMADVMMTDREIADFVATAADTALHFVGVPYEEMLNALHGVRADMEVKLATAFGPAIATAIVAAFITAVIRRRIELEAAGGTSPVLN
jgi:hypothetical protein